MHKKLHMSEREWTMSVELRRVGLEETAGVRQLLGLIWIERGGEE